LPYFVFSGDYALVLSASALFLFSYLQGIRGKVISSIAQLVSVVFTMLFFMGYLATEVYQYDYHYYQSVIGGQLSTDLIHSISLLSDKNLMMVIWMSGLAALVVVFVLCLVIRVILGFVGLLVQLFSVGDDSIKGINNSLAFVLTMLVPIGATYCFANEVNETKSRYLLPTAPLGDYIPTAMEDFCGGENVITLKRDFLKCGSAQKGHMLEEALSVEGVFNNKNLHPKAVYVKSFELMVAHSRFGSTMDEFSIEITWSENRETKGVLVVHGDKAPQGISIEKAGAYSELAYQAIYSTLMKQELNKSKKPDEVVKGWEKAKLN
jgi:hypothetical protein